MVLAGAVAVALLLASFVQPVRADRDHGGYGDAALLPQPGPMPAAPALFAEAHERAAGILRAVHDPSTALPALVEVLREAGVTVVSGPRGQAVIVGRADPRRMYLQAGQVLALSRAVSADQRVPLSWLTTMFAKGTTPHAQAVVSEFDLRSYLAKALEMPTGGAEMMWKALILGEEPLGSDLQATLRGALPDTHLSSLQLLLLTLRLRADAMQTAVALQRENTRTAPAPTASARAGIPCALDSIPDFVMDAIATATGAFAEHVLEKLKLGKLAKISAALGWVGTASTLINYALLFVALEIQTRITPDPLVRTKSTTEAGGRSDIVTMVRTRDVSGTPWLRCALRWLAVLGVSADAPAEGGPLPHAPVDWKLLDTRHAQVKPGFNRDITDESGTAKGIIIGRVQERDMSRAKFKVERHMILQTTVDAVAAREIWETVGHYSVVLIQSALAAFGSIPDAVEASIKVLAELASKNGQFANFTGIQMTDWEDHAVVHVDYEARVVHTWACNPCSEIQGTSTRTERADITARARIDIRYPMPGMTESGADNLRGVDYTYSLDDRYTKTWIDSDCDWETGWAEGHQIGTEPGPIHADLRFPVDVPGKPVGADLTIDTGLNTWNNNHFQEVTSTSYHTTAWSPSDCQHRNVQTVKNWPANLVVGIRDIHDELGQHVPGARFRVRTWKMNPNWKVGEEGVIATSTIDHQIDYAQTSRSGSDRLVETITLSTDAR
ncbi:hypothetical protein GCM10020358_50650 [Amorphoplanes nipponensis]|uniref:Uncharacterized protein n=1 Tax=Actinoplanes nipponensis TaxID=135950 RepID=A0A919JAK3_9ACTN|nr:hypothetical protein [Actinoplanes nipponensis]GIE47429.1 hypothetical protein Ani05nite_09630 [Actinoplanes nipponensis]